jgi:hypothetical protein
MSTQKKYFGMGLKPLPLLYFLNPFTKVNGNKSIIFKMRTFLLPSALAEGLSKLVLIWALATLQFE